MGQIINFNPITYSDLTTHSIWLYEKGFINNLDFDPKEWKWKKWGGLNETSFFNYQTKRKYRQTCSISYNTSPYEKELQRLGYSPFQRRIIHLQVWHIWRPKKISSFLWLLLNKGVPIGCWRKKVNLPTNYRLCNNEEEEDEEHAFFTCPSFKYAWAAFNRLRHHFSLSTLISWDEAKTRILPQPNQNFSQLKMKWDSKSSCVLSKETPWDLLRSSSLLWNIWVAKTQKEIRDEPFHLGSILFKS